MEAHLWDSGPSRWYLSLVWRKISSFKKNIEVKDINQSPIETIKEIVKQNNESDNIDELKSSDELKSTDELQIDINDNNIFNDNLDDIETGKK